MKHFFNRETYKPSTERERKRQEALRNAARLRNHRKDNLYIGVLPAMLREQAS